MLGKKKNSEKGEKPLEVETWPQQFQPERLAELNTVGNRLSEREGDNSSEGCCPMCEGGNRRMKFSPPLQGLDYSAVALISERSWLGKAC